MKKRSLSIIMVFALTLALLLPMSGYAVRKANAATARLNYKKIAMSVGEMITIKVSGAKAKSFASSKPAIASVTKGGLVTAKKPGKAVITVTLKNGKKLKCTVTVKKKATFGGDNNITFILNDGSTKVCSVKDGSVSIGSKSISYVLFGSYPQTEIKGDDLKKSITGATYDKFGYAVVGSRIIKRISSKDSNFVNAGGSDAHYYNWKQGGYRYFLCEPIRWRVLSNDKNKLFLLSEQALDTQQYNFSDTEIMWVNCTIRSWLNGNFANDNADGINYHDEGRSFMNTAFSAKEQLLLSMTETKNARNPKFNTEPGKDTLDKIFLLSCDDAVNGAFGFADTQSQNEERRCIPTDYARAMGAYFDNKYVPEGGCWWLLRTPGNTKRQAVYVLDSGEISTAGSSVTTSNIAIRPALVIDVSKLVN